MQHSGAAFFDGTRDLLIDGCHFDRLDGIGLYLAGFNRNATIRNSEFSWIGDTAIALWGRTKSVMVPADAAGHAFLVEGIDGTNGEQPRGTNIIANIVRELGHYSKQAAPFFQAKSAQVGTCGPVA